MSSTASDLAHRLARDPEAVCRHYLSNGRREGAYWLVGDVGNTPGRSLYVRLRGPETGRGAAGKWTDAATGEHGDLLDLIAVTKGLDSLGETLDEARRFLSLTRAEHVREHPTPAPSGSSEAARRLFATSKPTWGTLAETYLEGRGITHLRGCTALRFHPRCFYRPDAKDEPGVPEAWPALIAAVTDENGAIVGAHRTWLNPRTRGKAPVVTPRRAMGQLLGHGVRFGRLDLTSAEARVLAAGEGIESMLSLRMGAPRMPAIACLSANHLAALLLPTGLHRLYIAREDDPAGRKAASTLSNVAMANGVEPLMVDAVHGDLNEDLRRLGLTEVRANLRQQLAPQDVGRFMVDQATVGVLA